MKNEEQKVRGQNFWLPRAAVRDVADPAAGRRPAAQNSRAGIHSPLPRPLRPPAPSLRLIPPQMDGGKFSGPALHAAIVSIAEAIISTLQLQTTLRAPGNQADGHVFRTPVETLLEVSDIVERTAPQLMNLLKAAFTDGTMLPVFLQRWQSGAYALQITDGAGRAPLPFPRCFVKALLPEMGPKGTNPWDDGGIDAILRRAEARGYRNEGLELLLLFLVGELVFDL